jgi:aminoglycoside phosphotransferase family enzyme/predicted kinase
MTGPQHAEEPGQDAVLAFFDKGVAAGTMKRIDTHASIVFLEPERVLKIKRAVKLPFLDYSTLDKRKHACEEELAINRRYAPQIYRRSVPITRHSTGFRIGGDGPVVEWAVEMARFDESQTLDHLARAGDITPEFAETIADVLVATHREAESSDGSTWLASIAPIIDRNTNKFRQQGSLPPPLVDHLHQESHRQLIAAQGLLRERASAGLVRRCHGDAHLGNIVLIDHKPVLFDAIEFDPVIATTDVLYDVAFPIMDLLHFDLNGAANRLFNAYLQNTWPDNAGALRLMPLFLSIRAAIRSHVLFTKSEQSSGDRDAIEEARSYFDLALKLLDPVRPSLVAVGGKSGTGKSVLARGLASLVGTPPGAVILRSDVIRKQLFQVDPLVPLPAEAYAPKVTERVYCELTGRARQIITQGFSAVVDAAFLRKAERDALAAEAERLEATFRPIFLDADLDIRLRRIGSRTRDASDATGEVAAGQEEYDIGTLDWFCVDASGTPEQTLERSKLLLLQ